MVMNVNLTNQASHKFSALHLPAMLGEECTFLSAKRCSTLLLCRCGEARLLYLSLGPLSRFAFDQFVRVAIKVVQAWRENILQAFAWPYTKAGTGWNTCWSLALT